MWDRQRERVAAAARDFNDIPLEACLGRYFELDPAQAVLALFHDVAASVPAYKALLQEHGVAPEQVRSEADFRRLPLITKRNYLLVNSIPALCRQGRLESCDMFAVSSGSTGKPTFWPRFASDEYPVARRFEQVFHDGFAAHEKRTLAVVCFSLGTWVGGMFTTACCRHLAAKGYPISVVTPGNDMGEIFRVVTELGPLFEQVVLLGYPPFIKDVIDSGLARGVEWGPLRVKLVLAGEVFSEEWRDLVGERAGMTDPCVDSASLYGTADAGVLANETPMSVCIRRFLAQRPEAARELFGESRLPTLAQYDPLVRYLECLDGALVLSGDNGIPLLRYAIGDRGGLVGYRQMLDFLGRWGFDPSARLGAHPARELPFVFVFGRSDFTVSYFGANIYPENIAVGLEQAGVREWVTGKFVLEVVEDADRDRWLAVTVELAPGVEPSAARQEAAAASMLTELRRLNSELAHYVPEVHQLPRVSLKAHGDPECFPLGVKHRYTRRQRLSGSPDPDE